MSRPAIGPRAITRADGTTAHSSGAVHTLILRAADRLRPRTIEETAMARSDRTEADRKFLELRAAGYDGPINQDGEIPTKDNTDPRYLDAIYKPFRSADEYRSNN